MTSTISLSAANFKIAFNAVLVKNEKKTGNDT